MYQLALAFKSLGVKVYGYDAKKSAYTKVCEDNGIKVCWDINECAGKGYKVYRAVYNTETEKWSSWEVINDITKAEICEYLDQSVEEGITYRYTVKARSGKYASSYKSSEGITASLKAEEPTVPEETVTNVVEQWIIKGTVKNAEFFTVLFLLEF